MYGVLWVASSGDKKSIYNPIDINLNYQELTNA